MNIFASDRLEPSKVKFPGKFGKVEWTLVKSKVEFEEAYRKSKKIDYVVIDASTSENINGLSVCKILTEITIDKHEQLPIIMVIGPDEKMKKAIDNHLAQSKKWIDISRGK